MTSPNRVQGERNGATRSLPRRVQGVLRAGRVLGRIWGGQSACLSVGTEGHGKPMFSTSF